MGTDDHDWPRWARVVGWVLVIVVAVAVLVAVYLVLHEKSEADAISAVIQAVLAIATIILVWYTVRQVGLSREAAEHAREAAERAALDSLRERLDARGPRVIVAYSGSAATMLTAATKQYANVSEQHDEDGAYYMVSDSMPLGEMVLSLVVSFQVLGAGDVPAFTAVTPPGAEVDTADLKAVVPDGDNTYLTYQELLRGDEIREVAKLGAWPTDAPLRAVHVVVTDATRAIVDRYEFPVNWWPFERDGLTTLVRRSPRALKTPPRHVPAHRTYDEAV